MGAGRYVDRMDTMLLWIRINLCCSLEDSLPRLTPSNPLGEVGIPSTLKIRWVWSSSLDKVSEMIDLGLWPRFSIGRAKGAARNCASGPHTLGVKDPSIRECAPEGGGAKRPVKYLTLAEINHPCRGMR